MELAREAATEELARAVARLARPGDVIALAGGLGTGKTAFARAFIHARARAAGRAAEEVPSPTFTLVQAYELPGGTVHHFDLFRLSSSEEAIELGIEEAFADGISLIEWPDRVSGLLPAGHLEVAFAMGGTTASRRVRLTGQGNWPERLASAFAEARLG